MSKLIRILIKRRDGRGTIASYKILRKNLKNYKRTGRKLAGRFNVYRSPLPRKKVRIGKRIVERIIQPKYFLFKVKTGIHTSGQNSGKRQLEVEAWYYRVVPATITAQEWTDITEKMRMRLYDVLVEMFEAEAANTARWSPPDAGAEKEDVTVQAPDELVVTWKGASGDWKRKKII